MRGLKDKEAVVQIFFTLMQEANAIIQDIFPLYALLKACLKTSLVGTILNLCATLLCLNKVALVGIIMAENRNKLVIFSYISRTSSSVIASVDN